VAARTISTLHSILEHAVRLGKIEKNPARGVRKLACQPRDRRLSTAEIARLGKTLRELAAEGGRVTLVKVDAAGAGSRFAALRGRAGKGLSTDEIMALTRGEG